MSENIKTAKAEAAAPIVPPVVEQFELTLDEFCRQASSAQGASPELIAGFHHEQKAAGRIKASAAHFAQAFDRFAKQPA